MMRLLVIYDEREGADLAGLVEHISDPDHPRYGQPLNRESLIQQVEPTAEVVREVQDWLAEFGITPAAVQPPSVQLGLFDATHEQTVKALGTGAAAFLDRSQARSAHRVEWRIPRRLAGHIRQIRVWDGDAEALEFEGSDWLSDEALDRLGVSAPEGLGGLTPRDIADIYEFPATLTGKDECIALLMLSPLPAQSDLLTFWGAHGIDRGPSGNISVVQVGPPPTHKSKLGTLESTMIAQWAGAMAPDAKLVFYMVDPAAFDDPWVPFLAAVVADTKNRPTVACTSWLRSERNYYNRFGPSVIQGLLTQCAAIGVTVLAASGDWGCFDSFPTQKSGGAHVADTPWPQAVFPASEPLVLAVGGTMISHRDPLTEGAWSGPLPPGLNLPFESFAGGGGFSGHVPIPAWQRKHLMLAPDHCRPRPFSRGPEHPSVLAYGRGIPDVALAAAGRAIHRPGASGLTSDGYQAFVGGQWIDYAGGTSVAAPIWAAITACLNQARRAAAGAPRPMGFANPTFYALAPLYWQIAQPDDPFRDVVHGHNDVEVHSLGRDHKGVPRPETRRIPGYRSEDGWDPVTGLGVPRVAALAEAVAALVRAP